MEAKQIIKAYPTEKREVPVGHPFLNVSEFFYDSIQGEGVYAGQPAAFLRLQQCTLNCEWCDTKEVWRQGNPYTIKELNQMIDQCGLDTKLLNGQHLVITGGSPLLQQEALLTFFLAFNSYFGFIPFIEIENECVIVPSDGILEYVDCWNNSPKLCGSGNPKSKRYNPEAIRMISKCAGIEKYFKFVISEKKAEVQWEEIMKNFIEADLIDKTSVILMPEGATREELEVNREAVVQLAIREGVRYSTREHIVLWNRKTGI